VNKSDKLLVQEGESFRTTQKSKKSDFFKKSDFSVVWIFPPSCTSYTVVNFFWGVQSFSFVKSHKAKALYSKKTIISELDFHSPFSIFILGLMSLTLWYNQIILTHYLLPILNANKRFIYQVTISKDSKDSKYGKKRTVKRGKRASWYI